MVTIRKILLRVRLSQRIFLIFLVCVLLPLAIVFSLSFSHLEAELKDQGFRRLRYKSKNVAMSIMERLVQLESEMRFMIANDSSPANGIHFRSKNARHQSSHFESLFYVEPHGSRELLGSLDASPNIPVNELQAASFRSPGKTLIIQQETAAGTAPNLWMAIALDETDWLVARIHAPYIWNAESNFDLPPDTDICIVGAENTVLATSMADPAELIRVKTEEQCRSNCSAFPWSDGEHVYLATAYDLFLESQFSSSPWSILLTIPQQSLLASVRSFQVNLLMIGLLVTFTAFLLSSVSIRKNLNPLDRLTAAAEAMGRGDFAIRAALAGTPEVRGLSESFNAMAAKIEKQFKDLSESEQRFRGAFDDSEVGMALVNPDGRFLKVNRFLSSLLGYTQTELLSKNLHDLFSPDENPEGEHTPESPLSPVQGGPAVEKRLLHRDGRVVCGLFSNSLLRDGSNRPLFHVVHIQDITALKEAQRESQKLEAQLMHSQKMEAIGTLAAGIAHDFNNILSAILGYTEMAMMGLPAENAVTQDLDKVLQAGKRAAGLARQILSFSRRDSDEMAPVQLSSVVKEALKLLRATIPPHIAIVQNVSNDPLVVNADPTQIHQLIMNLCTNAYHAVMGNEAGKIEVSLTPEHVPASAAHEAGTYLKLKIADNGCGMTPEVRERIFEPYFTTKQKGIGTGLGLSIVHSIVKKHSGDIQVASEPGRGTFFEIRFPVAEQPPEEDGSISQTIASGSERILIVDDEAAVATVWYKMLTRQGYCVEAKNDPREALNDFRRNPDGYDLVITDLAMPGMTGDMLSAELSKIRPQLPIIMCTGYFEEMRHKPPCPAIKEYLIKPIGLGALAATVRKVIDSSAIPAAPAGLRC